MKSNPGGQLAATEVIGRDKLIEYLWRRLNKQSILLVAERRIGKTSVVKKMQTESRSPICSFYSDLERVEAPLRFVELIYDTVKDHLGTITRAGKRTQEALRHFNGTEIPGVLKFPETAAAHWKDLLERIMKDLSDAKDQRFVFFWDELPWMIQKVADRQDEATAIDILDTLRSIRQETQNIRMVYTGSIGLHHVLQSLKDSGYKNNPTNDMAMVEVAALSPESAWGLADSLLEGEGIEAPNRLETAKTIAESVDNWPYYIHHVVDGLFQRGVAGTREEVDDIVTSALTDANDPWHMRHYYERLSGYYPSPDDRAVALRVLDILACEEQPMKFDALFNLVKSGIATNDAELVRRVVTLLQRDHYLSQEKDGAFRFKFPLIRRSWVLQRGLGA